MIDFHEIQIDFSFISDKLRNIVGDQRWILFVNVVHVEADAGARIPLFVLLLVRRSVFGSGINICSD